MISLNEGEILGLYLILKHRENDEILQGVLEKIEPFIFDRLSLNEIENINEIYRDNPYYLVKRETESE